MRPSKVLPKYIHGLKNALIKYGAIQRDQYSWISKTEEYFIFSAERDHKDKVRNKYDHLEGKFIKKVRPLSKELGDAPLTVSHGTELHCAAKLTYDNKDYCKILIVNGTKYGTSSGGVRAVLDNDLWQFSAFSGTVEEGFEFILERVKAN